MLYRPGSVSQQQQRMVPARLTASASRLCIHYYVAMVVVNLGVSTQHSIFFMYALQDGMVIHHEVLEHGDFSQRQQVVRWVRRFPFSFLSDREYTQARRFFKEDDTLYACTKVTREHLACSLATLV